MESHELQGYDLYVVDDEYIGYSLKYKNIAEDACAYWKAFVKICGNMESDVIKGEFAGTITEFIEELGIEPGETFQSLLAEHAAAMNDYIEAIDEKDEKIY